MNRCGRRFNRSTHVAQKNTANHLKTTTTAVCDLRYVSVKPRLNAQQPDMLNIQSEIMNMQV